MKTETRPDCNAIQIEGRIQKNSRLVTIDGIQAIVFTVATSHPPQPTQYHRCLVRDREGVAQVVQLGEGDRVWLEGYMEYSKRHPPTIMVTQLD